MSEDVKILYRLNDYLNLLQNNLKALNAEIEKEALAKKLNPQDYMYEIYPYPVGEDFTETFAIPKVFMYIQQGESAYKDSNKYIHTGNLHFDIIANSDIKNGPSFALGAYNYQRVFDFIQLLQFYFLSLPQNKKGVFQNMPKENIHISNFSYTFEKFSKDSKNNTKVLGSVDMSMAVEEYGYEAIGNPLQIFSFNIN